MKKLLSRFYKLKLNYKELILPFILLLFGVYSAVIIYQATAGIKYDFDNHLISLAYQFNHKHLFLSPYNLPRGDYVDYLGNIYLYFGPLPSVLLMPFVLFFGKGFPQIWIGIFSLIVSFFAVYFISKRLKFSKVDSFWLSIFFSFSTVLFSVSIINITAYQIQALGAVFILLSLVEYFGKKRFILIGLFLALAGLTRFTLYLSAIFFLIEILRLRLGMKKIIYLLIPVFFSLIILGTYNYKRFRSVFETGYKYNITLVTYPMSSNIKPGFISFEHIPANVYNLLLKGPDPILKEGGGFIMKFPYLKIDPWGLAIWYTSPLFLYLLIKPKKSPVSLAALASVILLAIPAMLYFGVGYIQSGYRYALDFLPFLFILLLSSLSPKLSNIAKALIILGIVFNCIYLTSIWGIYPHFRIF